MHNKTLVLTLLSIFTLLSSIPMTIAHPVPAGPFPAGYDWTHLVIDSIGGPETTDPAWAYDAGSEEFISNVYETLVRFDRDYTLGPYNAGTVHTFVPSLATAWALNPDQITYTFKIRDGVQFHDGSILTAEDVEYSFERALIQDREGGPMWMLYEALLGIHSSRESNLSVDAEASMLGSLIDNAIEVIHNATGNYVKFINPFYVLGYGRNHLITWNRFQGIFEYYVEQELIDNGYLDIIKTAFQHWENYAGAHFEYRGSIPTDSITPGTNIRNDKNEVRMSSGVGGYAEIRKFGVFDNFDIFINELTEWSTKTPCPVGKKDFQDTITHEVGHVYGIGDVTDTEETMYKTGLLGDIHGRSLFIGDINGTQRVYPAAVGNGRFLEILSQPWASIIKKSWAVAEGEWPGWSVTGYINWRNWNNPAVSPLENAIYKPTGRDGGTGPYEYDYWTVDVARSVVKNDGGAADPNPGGPGRPPDPHTDLTPASTYWDGWPARVSNNPASPFYNRRIGGSVERVTWRDVPSWPSRLADALAGTADYFGTPRNFRDQVLGQSVGGELIRAYWRQPPNAIPAEYEDSYYVNLNASYTTPYYGLIDPFHLYGKDPMAWGAGKAPLDVFSDINVRRGFAYAFDYADFISTAYLNEASQPLTGHAKDLTKAEYYLKLAWGGVDSNSDGDFNDPGEHVGHLWTQGFALNVAWNTGNVAREYAASNIVNTLNNMNPGKFNLVSQGLLWGNVLLPAAISKELPVIVTAWSLDYQGLLLEYAIYPLVKPLLRNFEQAWVRGWYYHSSYSGSTTSTSDSTTPIYAYHLWKAKTHFGDLNNDGVVNVLDVSTFSSSWTGPPRGPAYFLPQADVTGGVGGTTGSNEGGVKGIPNGKVEIDDLSIISSYWDGPPQGPSHP